MGSQQNEENGYTVLTLVTPLGEAVTTVGCIPYAAPGERMSVTGLWVNHPAYGQQFAAEGRSGPKSPHTGACR